MHSLPIFVRLQGKPVILVGEGEAADAKRRLLERAGAIVVGEDSDAQFAIVALDNPENTVARLRKRGILINAVDRPDLCDFTLPAIVDRDPVLVAIGTGGASAGLSAALRQRLETLLPTSLGELAIVLQSARDRIRMKWPNPSDRRMALTKALHAGGPLDPLSRDPNEGLDSWLSGETANVQRRIESIWVSSNDPDDLKLRDARLLGEADFICHDPEISLDILARGRADAQVKAVHEWAEAPETGLFVHIHWVA